MPEQALRTAVAKVGLGTIAVARSWRGSQFWAHCFITPLEMKPEINELLKICKTSHSANVPEEERDQC